MEGSRGGREVDQDPLPSSVLTIIYHSSRYAFIQPIRCLPKPFEAGGVLMRLVICAITLMQSAASRSEVILSALVGSLRCLTISWSLSPLWE